MRAIRKVVTTVYCFADEADEVRESLRAWFNEAEPFLVGGAPVFTTPTSDEEAEVRPQFDEYNSED